MPDDMRTCIGCKHFIWSGHNGFDGGGTGICTKGHGWTESTAQGLSKPKPGHAYRKHYDFICGNYEDKGV